MAKQVKYRRGTTTQHTTFVGVDGEMTVDTDSHVVVVHDGSRAGGWPMANAVAVNTQIASLQANAGAQGDSIAVLYANAAIHYQLITQLSSNAATQQQSINQFLLTANAETITASFNAINANITAANLNIESLTTANLIQFENIVTLQGNIADIESLLGGTGFATVAYVDEAIGNINVGSSSQLINGNATASLGTDGLLTVSGRVVSEEIEGVANTLNIYSDWAKDTGISIYSETDLESVTLTSDRIVAVVANVGPLQKQWIFETDGDLLLPSGGDIKDAGTGLSVLGGGGSGNIGNFIFSSGDASLPASSTMTLSTYRSGANEESRLTLSPTTESSLYAAGVLKLGTGYGSGSEQYWQFGATGSLTFPDTSIQSTAFTGNISSLINGDNQVVLGSTGALVYPNGALQRDTGSIACPGNASTMVYTTSSASNQHTMKLLIQVEGFVGASEFWDTQACEMIIAKSFRANAIAETVYAVVHTSVAPLATFTAQWNALTSKVEVLCTAPSANSVNVKIFATEITTSD